MPRIARSLLAVAALLLLPGAVARGAQEPETIGIRLVDAPTNRQDDPRAQQYIVDHLAPGTTIRRRVEVSNNTSRAVTVELYVAAASITDGEFRFGEGRARSDLTDWAKLEPSSLPLEPGAKAFSTVTIAVPADASPGERYGVVWAELPAAAPPEGGIATVNRVGVRVYLSVGPGAEPAANFEVADLEALRHRDGTPAIAARVRNTGGRALDLTGELRLSEGPGGLTMEPVRVALGSLGLGQNKPVMVALDKAIPVGPWTARLTLRSGALTKTTEGRVTFPTQPGSSAGPEAPKQSTAVRVVLGAIMGLVFAGFVIVLFLGVRRRRREEEPT